MPDIFDEVEEDLRRERLKKAWDRFAPLVVGVALAIVFGVGGWRIYQHFQAQQQAADGDRYYAAMRLSAQNQNENAAAAFVTLSKDGTSGYRTLARLRAAAETALRDPAAALAAYDSFAADAAQPAALRDVARLRAGYLLVDAGTFADAEQRVGGLAQPGNPLRHSAREILGLAAWRAGDTAAARKWLETLIADGEAAQGFRQRGEVVLDLIASGEAPPPPVLASPPAPALPGSTLPAPLPAPLLPAPADTQPADPMVSPDSPPSIAPPDLAAPVPDASDAPPGPASGSATGAVPGLAVPGLAEPGEEPAILVPPAVSQEPPIAAPDATEAAPPPPASVSPVQ